MTTNDPDAIRSDIERTRAELSDDVDALGEKVSPRAAAERQTDKVKSALTGAKERVLGAADETRGTVSDTMSGGADRVREGVSGGADRVKDSPQQLRRKAEGNPLAAGVVAFGLGMLAAGLIPSSRREREAVQQVKESDQLQQATDQAKDTAREMGESLREPAEQAVQEVKDTATSGAEDVKETATSGAQEVKAEGQSARDDVTGTATESGQRLRESGSGS